MKKLYVFLLLGLGLGSCQHQPAPLATDQVNGLVGNAGYVAATGHEPEIGTSDEALVQAHLAFAERTLRRQTPANLSAALARRRAHLLDLLHNYWVAGLFPRNYDYPGERRPCFIDRDGRLCAVGYLVAATAGRPVAERINQAHQYDLIADMRTPALADWVQASGLTKAECALIQPTYGPMPPTEAESNRYAVGSAVWSATNVMFGAVNASQFNLPRAGRGVAYAGMLSGTGQLLVGALQLTAPGSGNPYGSPAIREKRTVSFLNVGVGSAMLALSAWNHFSKHPAAAPRTMVGVMNYPGPAGGTGLSISRRF